MHWLFGWVSVERLAGAIIVAVILAAWGWLRSWWFERKYNTVESLSEIRVKELDLARSLLTKRSIQVEDLKKQVGHLNSELTQLRGELPLGALDVAREAYADSRNGHQILEEWLGRHREGLSELLAQHADWTWETGVGTPRRAAALAVAQQCVGLALAFFPENKAAVTLEQDLSVCAQVEAQPLIELPEAIRQLGASNKPHLRSSPSKIQEAIETYRMARALRRRGVDYLAEIAARKATSLLDQQLGSLALPTLIAQTLQAQCVHTLGRSSDALHMIVEVLERFEENEALGAEHRDALCARSTYGRILIALGNFAEGHRVLKRTRKMQSLLFGVLSADALETAHELAVAFLNQNKLKAARGIADIVYRERVLAKGRDDVDSLASHYLLGRIAKRQGRLDEAEEALRSFAELLGSSLADNSPQTLAVRHELAHVLFLRGDRKAALPMIREVVQTRVQSRSIGRKHRHTLASKQLLATILYYDDELDEALLTINETIQYQTETLGAHVSETTNSENLRDKIISRLALVRPWLNLDLWCGIVVRVPPENVSISTVLSDHRQMQ